MTPTPLPATKRGFDPSKFLAPGGEGRKIAAFPKKQSIFSQGDAADEVFYIQKGKVRLSVVSRNGKEATLGILNEGEFFGEGSLGGQSLRMGSATAMAECEILRIDKKAMMLALHREHAFSDFFVAYLLARNIRYEEDLVDQIFNSSEKRLARLLLLRSLRQARRTRNCNPKDQPGDPCGDDRHNPVAGKLFHESVQETRLP